MECILTQRPDLDTYEAIQARPHNATWPSEFQPVAEGPTKRIADVLLWLLHSRRVSCAVVGESAMNVAGKLISRPDFLTVYIAHHPQNLSRGLTLILFISCGRYLIGACFKSCVGCGVW